MPLQTTGTHHVAIYTANFEAIRDFYVNTLDMPLCGGFAGYNTVFVDAGSIAIEIEEDTGGHSDAGGWRHLALEVPDVDAAYRELVARGVPFHVTPELFPPEAPTMRIALFRDPDGNELELIQPLGTRYG